MVRRSCAQSTAERTREGGRTPRAFERKGGREATEASNNKNTHTHTHTIHTNTAAGHRRPPNGTFTVPPKDANSLLHSNAGHTTLAALSSSVKRASQPIHWTYIHTVALRVVVDRPAVTVQPSLLSALLLLLLFLLQTIGQRPTRAATDDDENDEQGYHRCDVTKAVSRMRR